MATPTTPSTPELTAEQRFNQILQQFEEKISTLEAKNKQLTSKTTKLKAQNGQLQTIVSQLGKAKLSAPDKYRGDKMDLTRFLTQIQAYLQYYPKKFANEYTKTLFVASYLKSKVLRQFESTIKDYLKYNDDEAYNDFTNKVFNDYKEFKKEIRKVFRDIDKKLYTQERLGRL